jgi:hypothetical protein
VYPAPRIRAAHVVKELNDVRNLANLPSSINQRSLRAVMQRDAVEQRRHEVVNNSHSYIGTDLILSAEDFVEHTRPTDTPDYSLEMEGV